MLFAPNVHTTRSHSASNVSIIGDVETSALSLLVSQLGELKRKAYAMVHHAFLWPRWCRFPHGSRMPAFAQSKHGIDDLSFLRIANIPSFISTRIAFCTIAVSQFGPHNVGSIQSKLSMIEKISPSDLSRRCFAVNSPRSASFITQW